MVDEDFQVVDVANVGRHHVAVISGDAVALSDLGCVAGQGGDLGELTGRRTDADHHAQRVAQAAGIHVGVIAANHPSAFQALDPLRHGRRGQADSPAEFGERRPRIGLELGQKTEICRVEKVVGGEAASPYLRRHSTKCTFVWSCWKDECADRLGCMADIAVPAGSGPVSDGGQPSGCAAAAIEKAPPHVFFLISAVFHYLGPAFAVLLFVRVDVLGVAWLRIVSAAVIFAGWRKPWRAFLAQDRSGRRLLVAWGGALAVMNACFYTAIDRLPLGTVAAIEFLPVIALAALGARSVRNAAALLLAAPGVYLLTDVQLSTQPVGLVFAFANAILFALYIVLADRVAKRPEIEGIDGLAASMLIAAVVITPIGGWAAVPAFGDPVGLLAGIGVGISSSVIPYVTDQLALARLSRATYALMVSLLPATAVVIGIVILTQIPTALETIGVALVVAGVALHRDPGGGDQHQSPPASIDVPDAVPVAAPPEVSS
jgi:inner membrane transporter RhtA